MALLGVSVRMRYNWQNTLEQNFDIGKLYIDVKGINVGEFSLGQVAVLDILLESKWNERIKNVYGEISVFDSDGSELPSIKTASIDLEANSEGILKAYWDTSDLKVGKYNLNLLVHYNDRVTEKLVETEVNIDSIRTNLGFTAEVTAGSGIGRDNLLVILVLVLVAINIAWFVFFMRKKWKS